jgi:hypothetical protein
MKGKLTRNDKMIISAYIEKNKVVDETLLEKIRKAVVKESGKFRKDKYSDLDENEQYAKYLFKVIDAVIGKV